MEKKTTSTNKEKADCTLKDGAETEIMNVTIWADFPGFADLMPGSKVTGTLNPAKDPKYGPTLYPPKAPRSPSGGGYKAKMIDDAMVKKEASIIRFQDTKELSIKVSSTFRAAVDTALAEWERNPSYDYEQIFEKWRKFYWMKFDVSATQYPPF